MHIVEARWKIAHQNSSQENICRKDRDKSTLVGENVINVELLGNCQLHKTPFFEYCQEYYDIQQVHKRDMASIFNAIVDI